MSGGEDKDHDHVDDSHSIGVSSCIFSFVVIDDRAVAYVR